MQLGGGASYQFTNFLSTQAQATYYDQYYFDKSYTGTFITGTVNYTRRILDMFTFSAGCVGGVQWTGQQLGRFRRQRKLLSQDQGLGNFRIVQLCAERAVRVSHRTPRLTTTTRHGCIAAFGHWPGVDRAYSGSRSGLTNQPGTDNHSEGYSTSISSRRFTVTGNYTKATGQSILTSAGLVSASAQPRECRQAASSSSTETATVAAFPRRRLRHLTISGTFSRALSNTLSEVTNSRNNTELFNAQLQYHLRRIGVLAGFTRFSQGISASGTPPGTANSYFIGVSRWFDFF